MIPIIYLRRLKQKLEFSLLYLSDVEELRASSHLQFSVCRRPTIITRECSTDTSAEEIIYTGHTDANNIILHLSGNSFQTGHIHCFMQTSNLIS